MVGRIAGSRCRGEGRFRRVWSIISAQEGCFINVIMCLWRGNVNLFHQINDNSFVFNYLFLIKFIFIMQSQLPEIKPIHKPKGIEAFLQQKLKHQQDSSTESQSPIFIHEFEPNERPSRPNIVPSSVKRPKVSIFSKPPKAQEGRDKNNDDLGEAAEWAEMGTKNVDVDFNEEESLQHQTMVMVDAPVFDKDAVMKKIQNKARQMGTGGFRGASSTNAARLLEKAKGIKEQNQRLSPRRQDTKPPSATNQLDSPKPIPKVQQLPSSKPPQHNLIEPDSEQQDNKWNQINKQTIVSLHTKTINKKIFYTVEEIKNYYTSLNLRQQKRQMNIENLSQQVDDDSFSFFGCFAKKKRINADVKSQILALTRVHISEDIDVFLLESIWKSLTPKNFMRFGNHWQEIGFQGHDPSTDLRSTGILSLLLIYFYKEQNQDSFKDFHTFSRNQDYDFPLMITMIKVVGKYTDLITKNLVHGNQLEDYLEWFYAIGHYMVGVIKEKKYNIRTIGEGVTGVLNKIESKLDRIRKQYKDLIR